MAASPLALSCLPALRFALCRAASCALVLVARGAGRPAPPLHGASRHRPPFRTPLAGCDAAATRRRRRLHGPQGFWSASGAGVVLLTEHDDHVCFNRLKVLFIRVRSSVGAARAKRPGAEWRSVARPEACRQLLALRPLLLTLPLRCPRSPLPTPPLSNRVLLTSNVSTGSSPPFSPFLLAPVIQLHTDFLWHHGHRQYGGGNDCDRQWEDMREALPIYRALKSAPSHKSNASKAAETGDESEDDGRS